MLLLFSLLLLFFAAFLFHNRIHYLFTSVGNLFSSFVRSIVRSFYIYILFYFYWYHRIYRNLFERVSFRFVLLFCFYSLNFAFTSSNLIFFFSLYRTWNSKINQEKIIWRTSMIFESKFIINGNQDRCDRGGDFSGFKERNFLSLKSRILVSNSTN